MGNVQADLAGKTPVGALRPTSREIIAGLFDQRGRIHNGRVNDYRGFLEILKVPHSYFLAYSGLPEGASQSLKLIDDWPKIAQADGSSAPTILEGWRILEQLGRQDILEQCCRSVEEDVQVFQSRRAPPHQLSHSLSQPNNFEEGDTDEFHSHSEPPQRLPHSLSQPNNFEDDSDKEYIFVDDVRRGAEFVYDAFVVGAPSDREIVTQLLKRLREKGIRLIDPENDVLPGVPLYSVWAYAIDKRCRKLILVIGNDFTKSEYCTFAVNYATALSPDAGNRKIIVIKVQDNIAIHRSLNFYKAFPIDGQLSQLVDAIRAPSYPEPLVRSVSCPAYRNIACVSPLSRRPTSDTQVQNGEVERESLTNHRGEIADYAMQSTHMEEHFSDGDTHLMSDSSVSNEQFESSLSSFDLSSTSIRSSHLVVSTRSPRAENGEEVLYDRTAFVNGLEDERNERSRESFELRQEKSVGENNARKQYTGQAGDEGGEFAAPGVGGTVRSAQVVQKQEESKSTRSNRSWKEGKIFRNVLKIFKKN